VNKERFLLSFPLVIAMVILCGGTTAAQQAADVNGVPVRTVVTVEPRKGPDVPVVNLDDVMVHEGKDRDKVTDWVAAQGDHAALEFFVLLDDSSGISLGSQLEDIRRFILAQPASAKVGVAYMQNGTARIEQDLTNDHGLAAKALRLPLGIGGANGSPYFSVSDLVKHWPQSGGRREVLMVSSGIDRYYGGNDMLDPYLTTAIEDAQRAGVLVSAIYSPGAGHFGHDYWQTYWGQLYLAKLADETGGESYYIGFTGPPVAFAPFLDDLANRLNHQFLLGFLAKPEKKAGMRQVKITTEVTNADLVAPRMIYVPAGQ
jgi:hypothetical protein